MRVSEGVVEGAFGWARGKAGGRLTAILRAGVPTGPAPGAGGEGEAWESGPELLPAFFREGLVGGGSSARTGSR
jgi:hypothetical protein